MATIADVIAHDSGRSYDILDVVLYLVGAAGLAAAITIGFLSMRAVLSVGGFCAEGGPYVIQTPCPEGTDLLMPLAIFGGLGAAGLMGWKGSALGAPFDALVTLAWPALFISLGWNFLEFGIFPGDNSGPALGFLIPGVLFEVMGITPLVLGLLPSRRSPGPTVSWPTDSPVVTVATRKRLLNDLVTHAHERGWGAQDDMVSKLERLATLKEQGALTQDEFDAAKKQLLGGAEG